MTTIATSVAEAVRKLRAARIPDPLAEAEFMTAGILKMARLEMRLKGDRALTAAEARKLGKALARRLEREPLSYVLGTQQFLDLSLEVRPGVFIPRPETEELVSEVMKLRGAKILDLCTGSGAIAIALAKRLPGADVSAVELHPEPYACAKRNARRNGVDIRFLRGDLFAPLTPSERFDIIVSNPPYVRPEAIETLAPEVRKEPRAALDGGPKGLAVIERIVLEAPERLNAGGWLVLEMDPGQTGIAAKWMQELGFAAVEILKDSFGRKRIIKGRAPHPSGAFPRGGKDLG